MILENRTAYESADIEAVILRALVAAGITSHAHERVVVRYGPFSGWCHKGTSRMSRRKSGGRYTRMLLRIPRPTLAQRFDPRDVAPSAPAWERIGFDMAQFVWLVRHEVAHWRGLDHSQMSPALRYWSRAGNARAAKASKVGRELPLPDWAIGLEMRVAATALEAKPPTSKRVSGETRAERLEHAERMLARAERRAKLAATIVKRWKRRVGAARRAIERAEKSAAA